MVKRTTGTDDVLDTVAVYNEICNEDKSKTKTAKEIQAATGIPLKRVYAALHKLPKDKIRMERGWLSGGWKRGWCYSIRR